MDDSIWLVIICGLLVFIANSIICTALIVCVLVKLPATYYQAGQCPANQPKGNVSRLIWVTWLTRNLLGVILVIVGVFLSLPGVPGQGILTILVGIMVLDFPSKRRLVAKLVRRPGVLRSINRLRNRFGKPPLVLDTDLEKSNEAG